MHKIKQYPSQNWNYHRHWLSHTITEIYEPEIGASLGYGKCTAGRGLKNKITDIISSFTIDWMLDFNDEHHTLHILRENREENYFNTTEATFQHDYAVTIHKETILWNDRWMFRSGTVTAE